MKPSFWITLVVSTAVCIAAVMAQTAHNRKLATRLANEQVEANKKTEPTTTAPTDPATPVASDPAASKARLDQALTELQKLAALGNKDKALILRMPQLLRSAKGLGADELIAAAAELPDSHAKSYLLMLAAEQDPQRVYKDETLTAGISSTWKLALLGRRDPAAALEEIPPLQPRGDDSTGDRSGMLLTEGNLAGRVHYATKLLGVDLEQGLNALREIDAVEGSVPLGVMLSMGTPSLPQGSIPGLVDAMERPENAELRDDIIRMTVTHTLFNEGVEEMARVVNMMELSPEEMQQAVERSFRLSAIESEPAAMVAWLSEVQPAEAPGALIEWADQDLKGATNWLSQQPPSPVRDQTIAEFAHSAARLDPASAAQWANEIQDETLREQTLQRIPKK